MQQSFSWAIFSNWLLVYWSQCYLNIERTIAKQTNTLLIQYIVYSSSQHYLLQREIKYFQLSSGIISKKIGILNPENYYLTAWEFIISVNFLSSYRNSVSTGFVKVGDKISISVCDSQKVFYISLLLYLLEEKETEEPSFVFSLSYLYIALLALF